MGKNDQRGDISEETQSESSQILFWIAIVIGGGLLLFLVIWLMLRINYKLREIRESFWPTIGRILCIALIIALGFGLFVLILNAVSRRKYKDEEFEDPEGTTRD